MVSTNLFQFGYNLSFLVVSVILLVPEVHPLPTNSDGLELIILHNNDMHARFEQTGKRANKCSPTDVNSHKCYGGFARTAHEIRKYRSEAQKPGGLPVLYLNAGDTYTGTPWFTIFKDNITSAFLNILKPDAISLGNHEFDEGVEGLIPFLNAANFPVLAANLDLTKTPELQRTKSLKNYTIFNINEMKIGVIGYLTPETKHTTIPNDVEYFDEVDSINESAELLKKQGVQIIIALGHSGYETDRKIATLCPEVDLVIGGHTNTFLYTGPQPDIEVPVDVYPKIVTQLSGKIVPVVQAYAYTKYLGKLHLKFDSEGNLKTWDGEPILLNGTVPEDSDVLQLLELYRPNITFLETSIVGKTKVLLDGSKGSCRKKECNLGNLVADSMVYIRASKFPIDNSDYWSDTSIAFVPAGGLRASIEKGITGDITQSDVLTVLPFVNTLYIIKVPGSKIKESLEISAKNLDLVDSDGGFLQMSGVHVVYNLSKDIGDRVEHVSVLCTKCSVPHYEPLDLNINYKIIMSDFLLDGGDGYNFTDKKDSKSMATNLEITDSDALMSYIEKKTPIYPGEEWRITVVGEKNNGTTGGAILFGPSVILTTLMLILIKMYY